MTFQSLKEIIHPQIWIQEMKIIDYLKFGATIRIGGEMLSLPYAGFFKIIFSPSDVSKKNFMHELEINHRY